MSYIGMRNDSAGIYRLILKVRQGLCRDDKRVVQGSIQVALGSYKDAQGLNSGLYSG